MGRVLDVRVESAGLEFNHLGDEVMKVFRVD